MYKVYKDLLVKIVRVRDDFQIKLNLEKYDQIDADKTKFTQLENETKKLHNNTFKDYVSYTKNKDKLDKLNNKTYNILRDYPDDSTLNAEQLRNKQE